MILPGVPRGKRIGFVHKLIGLLLEEGIDGIAEQEHQDLSDLMQRLMDSATPTPEVKEDEEPAETPGGC